MGIQAASWLATALAMPVLSLACRTGADAPAAPPTSSAVVAAELPSWNEGKTRETLVSFVESVTREGSPDFVPPGERIAVFDNDGTLWCEQPVYFQLAFALDRIQALAPDHPEWKDKEPFKSALARDLGGVMKSGKEGLVELVMASHAGMSTDEFAATAKDWLAIARHPKYDRPYTELVYQPMLEVLDYLRSKGFKTFIVSGGGIEFLRVFAEEVYGIPPEQVVGSSIKITYEFRDGVPLIVRSPELDFIDDGPGKPVGIHRHIGRRPILAFGNSDGDREMIEYTTVSNPRPALGVFVHHTDGEREVAYDRDSHIGQLDRSLDQAPERGWLMIDMKKDWKVVFPD